MFDFLNFFSSGASIFAAGSSMFNTYAQLRANKEKASQELYKQRYLLKEQQEHDNFDQQQFFEKTAEYGAISSYHIDILRQEQMHNRQQLGYNILQTGIGITATDSAGLLLKHMAYMDEMKARSVEAEYFYGRPRSGFNPVLASLQKEAANRSISQIKSASPWLQAATVFSGMRDLAAIGRIGSKEEKPK
jgi:hypothetical protein